MKNFFVILLVFISAVNVQAQYVFNNCNYHPAFNDSLIGSFNEYDTTGFTSGSAGANVTWNYIDLSLKYTWPVSHYYFDPALTEGYYLFPNADVADSLPDGVYAYLTYSPDSVSFLGDYHDSISFNASWDPRKESVCSLSYGNSFTDFFARYNFSQCPYHHTYTARTVTYDAYGTINLKKKNVSVARLKIVENTLDSAVCVGPPIIKNTVDTTYIWYDVNTHQPVFSWHYFNDTLNSYKNILVLAYTYFHLPALVAGIQQENTLYSTVSIYPNPTNGKFRIGKEGGVQEECDLEIFNALGKRVFLSNHADLQSVVDISSQPDGIYFLSIRTNTDSFLRKVIIAR